MDFGHLDHRRTKPSHAAPQTVRPVEQPRGLLEIQRAAGNAATVELIRRQRASATVMRQPVGTQPVPAGDATADSAAAAGETKRPTLQQGSTGDDVKLLQMKLRHVRERAHDQNAAGRARIDGIFGPLTEEDVVDFQGDSGLKADGIAGPKTWDALDSLVPETPIESEELALDDQFTKALALKSNRQYDAALAEFESLLAGQTTPERIGVLAANIAHCHQQRGRFKFAVERYEQALSGRFNQEELRAETLERLMLARQNQFAGEPAPDPEPVLGPGGQPAEGHEGGGITARDEVKAGDAGDSVDLFKGKLANILIGWAPELGPGNGFDAATETRTRVFQQQSGMAQTGIGDATTWHALDSFSKPDIPFSVVSPLLARGRTAYALMATDTATGISQLEGIRDEAAALGLDEIVKNTEALIGRGNHQLSRFGEAAAHYSLYLERVMPAPPHYGFFLESLRLAHDQQPPPSL